MLEFDFDLNDRDGFTLQTVHAKDLPALASGIKNTFQGIATEEIPYATAIKVREVLVRPSIVKCYTCQSRG
jgi:hypothetical protein